MASLCMRVLSLTSCHRLSLQGKNYKKLWSEAWSLDYDDMMHKREMSLFPCLSRSLSQLTEGERHPGRWPVSHWQTDTGTFIPTDNLESPANLTPVTTWPASNSANHHTHINPIKPTWFMKRWQRGKHHIYSSIFTEQRWSAFIEQVRCGHSISASS